MVHLNKLTLLLAIATLVNAGQHLPGHRIRHRREFASPTAIVRRQQDTVQQLQEALDSFLGGDNPSAAASGNSKPADEPQPTPSSKAPPPAEETDENGAIIISDDLEESPSSAAPTSSEVPPTSSEVESRTSTSESSRRSIEVGGPTSSKVASSEEEPTSTRESETRETESATLSSKETETEKESITIGEPSTEESESAKPTSTKEQEEASSTVESSSEEPTKSIEIGESSTRRSTREEEASSTKEEASSTEATETETEEEKPTSEPSITIGDPTSSEEVTRTRSSTVEESSSSRTRTEEESISISVSVEEPTESATRTRSSTREEESSSITISEEESSSEPPRTRSSTLEEESSSISIKEPVTESSEPPVTRSSTREPEPSTRNEGSISIGFPSVVPNTTDEFSVTRSNTRSRTILDPSSEPFTESATVSASSEGPRGNSTRSSTFEQNVSTRSTAEPGTGVGSASAGPTRSANEAPPSGVASDRPASNNSGAASQAVPTAPSSSRASNVESSTRRPNSFYDFVPTSELIVNTDTSSVTTERPSATGSINTGASAAEESISSVTIATALPSSLPAKIVPGDAPPETPEDSTLVSLLFQVQTLGWKWLVSSPDTAGQVFAYMPNLLAAALNISESDIQNTALVAYQSLTDTEATQLMTVYLAALPTTQLSNLQAQIKTPSSQLYSQNDPILHQLSQQLVATFPVNAFTSTEQATIGQSPTDADEDKKTDKKSSSTTVIAVVASFGSVIVLLLAFIAFRYYKRNKAGTAPNLRALQLGRESPPAGSPAMSQRSPAANRHAFSGLFTSHHYAASGSSRHSVGSDSSGHSSDRSAGHNNREVQRGISWYSGRYTDFGEDENGSPRSRSVYGQAITQDLNSANNPFSDRQAAADDDEAGWLARSEGVRRLKTGQVQISRPQLEGNSLML